MSRIVIESGGDFWDHVPVRLAGSLLALAAVCAGVGRYAVGFTALAVVLYALVGFGLMLFGYIGSVMGPFQEGVLHGIAYILLPPFYPIYFYATHPLERWAPFVNMVAGFGLIWIGTAAFPGFGRPEPARPVQAAAGADSLDQFGPKRVEALDAATVQVIATTDALTALLAGVKDEPTAKRAAPRYRQLIRQLQRDHEAAGDRKAVSDSGELLSISGYLMLGAAYRDASHKYNEQRKRIRKNPAIAAALDAGR